MADKEAKPCPHCGVLTFAKICPKCDTVIEKPEPTPTETTETTPQ
jgi:rRNA maturation protein Nop10